MSDFPLFPKSKVVCLAKKHLTPFVWAQLKDVKTPDGIILLDLIRSALQNPASKVGVYLPDKESYHTFAPFVNKVIEDYHHPYKVSSYHVSNFSPCNMPDENLDEEGKYILSTRIRVARNFAQYKLPAGQSTADKAQILADVTEVLSGLEGELAGKMHVVTEMSKADIDSYISKGMLFEVEPDHNLKSCSIVREDWPANCGFYAADSEKFIVWVNEEDAIRIVSMEKGGDIKAVFSRLSKGVTALESKFAFLKDKHLGNLASCPTNIGTGMRASVHIKLPKVARKQEEFDAICEEFKIQARGSRGELSEAGEGGIYDISNLRRLGLSEVQCVQDMYEGVKALIKLEESIKR